MPSTTAYLKQSALSCAITAVLVTASAPAAAYTGLYVFGDSLSDNGNLLSMSGFYPPVPYWQGRFSNGPVAVEVLATGLGAALHDMAIGGARTGLSGSGDGLAGRPTGMLTQLGTFQASLGGAAADSNALYLVWGGANDMRDGLAIGTQDAVAASMTTAITNLATIVGGLYGQGARNFLLPNLPDLGLTPEARSHGPGAAGAASFISGVFNQQLSATFGSMAAAWPDEHFYYFDVMGAQQQLTLGSPGNGFTNVTASCLDTPGCNPAEFLYWDTIHPTAATHAQLGAQMLAAVPEPATMLMMAVGVLALLGVGRRRQA